MQYQLNSRNITFEELCFGTPWAVAVIAWPFAKLFQLGGSTDLLPVERLDGFRVDKSELDDADLERFQPLAQQVKQQGFKGTIYHQLEDSRHQAHHAHASYLHQSGRSVARIRYRDCKTSKKKFLVVEFITLLSDGSVIVTSGGKCDLLSPEQVDDVFLGSASVEELWRTHLERTKPAEDSGQVVQLKSAKQLLIALEQHHLLCKKDLVERGVFKPVEAQVVDGELVHEDEDPVLAAVRKQESNSQNWMSTVLVLLVSMAFFFGAGAAAWSLSTTLMLIGVLLVHELGHFAAMHIFDYKNLKMFFIPFLGAAVTGRNYNVDGWKRVVVSLMGPVPGILAGAVLGIYGVMNSHELALEIAMMLVILNGFNLLPSLPLDGGWVMHTLLFSRNPYVDIASRCLAAFAVIGLALISGAGMLTFVGISMLVGIPHVVRTVKIADRLRRQPEFETLADDSRIPDQAVKLICKEIDKSPTAMAPAVKATTTLQIYEMINARPPGVVASLALGGVYCASVLCALISAGVFAMAMHTDLGQFMADAAFGPQTIVNPSEVQVSTGEQSLGDLTSSECVIASYLTRSDAEQGYAQLADASPQLPAVLFGNQLLAPIQENDQRVRILDLLEPTAESLFVDRDDYRASFRLQCIAPTERDAEHIASMMSAFGNFSQYDLPPLAAPWAPSQPLTDKQILARQTYERVAQARIEAYDYTDENDPLSKLSREMATAERMGDNQKAEQLQKEYQQLSGEQEQKAILKLRDEVGDELDLEILEHYMDWFAWTRDQPEGSLYVPAEEYDAGERVTPPDSLVAMVKKMGVTETDSPYTASTVQAHANGVVLTFNLIYFDSPATGSVSLLQWLDEQGCFQFKADFLTY